MDIFVQRYIPPLYKLSDRMDMNQANFISLREGCIRDDLLAGGIQFPLSICKGLPIPFHNPQRKCTSCDFLCICEHDLIPSFLP
ncbi:hypothetical protein OUZ56_017413 [Daphnia magna]|uniref:Uncharacterized protein n=1 Tax=Daphnia magna TaxID=35525 RepID=A0ABR0AT66_9CRUS|nr:hypothetical protein OUZ56_017413 [Daphnia magna]